MTGDRGHVRVVYHRYAARCAAVLLAVALAWLALPATAAGHGAVDPEASVDLARLIHVPAGVRVRVVDGDLRLWMSVPPARRVTVLDYAGAPYLRFTPRGVLVNQNSAMFYLNLIPPITPAISLTRATPVDWHLASHGHAYTWHDGRIAALASTIASPGARVLGDWSVPLLLDGRRAAIRGVLDHRPRPSLAWLWPAAATLLMLPALLRVRAPALERRVGAGVVAVTLLGVVAASLGAGLHGRPGLSATLVAIMAVELTLAAGVLWRLVRGHRGWAECAVTAILALFRGIAGIAVLWRGYVLLAMPAAVARAAVAVCLAGGLGLAVMTVWLVDRHRPVSAGTE